MTIVTINGIQYHFQPRVSVLSVPTFEEPAHLPVRREGYSPDAERLMEYAGRLCYMSQDNPAGKTTKEYLSNILAQGHGSVLEHAQVSVLLEGVSRSFTHELVRHRAGFAYSQLSQRYVDESDTSFVVPPAIVPHWEDPIVGGGWRMSCEDSVSTYIRMVEALLEDYADLPKTDRRKRAREAARSVLPNCTETKIVVSANLRAWRTMLELRTNPAADAEMRRCATAILLMLEFKVPGAFSDVRVDPETGGITFGHHKV